MNRIGGPCTKTAVAPQATRQAFGSRVATCRRPNKRYAARAHKVELDVAGKIETLTVEDGDNILNAALDAGLDLSHDCKMGVCMTCPAKLVSGDVDQSAGMLDEDARAKGYTLLCVSEPQSDCKIQIIEEDEILEQVLG